MLAYQKLPSRAPKASEFHQHLEKMKGEGDEEGEDEEEGSDDIDWDTLLSKGYVRLYCRVLKV